MRKIISALALAAMVLASSPAYAHDRGGYYPPYYPYNQGWTPPPPQGAYRTYEYRRYEYHDNTNVLVPLIGGVILGAIINDSQNRPRYQNQDRVQRVISNEYRYDQNCDCYRR